MSRRQVYTSHVIGKRAAAMITMLGVNAGESLAAR